MNRPPTVAGLEAAANYFANALPDFSAMTTADRAVSRRALRTVAAQVQALRVELDDACPSCGAFVEEGVAHG